MKRWAVYTVLLYALALILLTVPMVLLAFIKWGDNDGVKFREALALFQQWGYWLWLAVLVGGQALLLLVPIQMTERRFIPRRTLKIPCLVVAFLLANLFFAGIVDILCAAFNEEGVNLFSYLIPFNPSLDQPQRLGVVSAIIVTLLVFWIVWTIIFRHFADSDDPGALMKRAVRWLLNGSILELLVAVPTHIIVRRRGDCCAPIGTFWGIATGISIMLLCFGPGVYFLFATRARRLKAREAQSGDTEIIIGR